MLFATPSANQYHQQRPRKIEIAGVVVHSPTDAQLAEAGWLPEIFESLGPYQQHGAPNVGEDAVRYPAEDLPLEAVAEIKRAEIEDAHTAAMPKPQSSINRLLMRGSLLAFQAAAVGLSEEEAEQANALIGLASMVQTIDAHRSELLADIDAALAAGDRARLLGVVW